MKWFLALIVAFVIFSAVPGDAAEWRYSLTGQLPNAYYNLSFNLQSSGTGGFYELLTSTETKRVWQSNFPVGHYMVGHSDSLGNITLRVYTATALVGSMTGLVAAPYVPLDGVFYSQVMSFLIGSLTATAFVMASSSMYQGPNI